MEPVVLLHELSPNGNTYVVVEHDDRVCFMYLGGTGDVDISTKSVWVRNLIDAPKELDVKGMQDGRPPAMPAAHCRHRIGQQAPSAEKLRVIWLPEGNGVALLEGGEFLAIIPPWSGEDNFDGFARDSIGEGPFGWELTKDNLLLERFAQAQQYWESWDGNLWPVTRENQIAALEAVFGEHTNYYAIDGGDWPPKAMLRFRSEDYQVLATIGVSLRPQPNVELYLNDPASARRVEFAVALRADLDEPAVKRVGSYLSAQSKYPWARFSWLGSGHTIPCDSWSNSIYDFAAITDTSPIGKQPAYPPMLEDPVNLLWFLPITVGEQKLAAAKTTEELLSDLPVDRWREG